VDPDVALANLREAMAELRACVDDGRLGHAEVAEAVESFEALDGWLTNGGFKPRDWRVE